MNFERLRELLRYLGQHAFSAIATGLAVVSLVFAGFWRRGIDVLRETHSIRNQEYNLMLDATSFGPLLRQELTAVREYTYAIESNLVDEDELADNDDYFRRMQIDSGVIMDNLQQLSSPRPAPSAVFRTVPFTLQVSGTYAQALDFLYRVETGPRLAGITSLSMQRLRTGEADITLQLDVNLLGKL